MPENNIPSEEDVTKTAISAHTEHPREIDPSLNLFEIKSTDQGYSVRLPGGVSDIGVVAFRDQTFPDREAAESAILKSKAGLGAAVELESLRKSFSSFHSIGRQEDGQYEVVFPAFHSTDNPALLVGTSKRKFDSWQGARDFYLETRNRNDYPENGVFDLQIGELQYSFQNLERYGQRARLATEPMTITEATRKVIDFDKRNVPDTQSALTYYETIKTPGWEDQIFHFVENYSQSQEGKDLLSRLKITDLRLLTPHQAASLTLEMVTRLKKYSNEDIGRETGETSADQKNAIALLYSGLNNRDKTDFKGNGICRNFASAVKVVFDGLKASQTSFNYLNDTYCFYESGERADYNPMYDSPQKGVSVTIPDNKTRIGHAWNSFITIQEQGASHVVVEATWSNIDFDTQRMVNADFTLQRMEKDVFRNVSFQKHPVDMNSVVQFYAFLIDSLPQTSGVVLDDELKARVRSSTFYREQRSHIISKYPGLSEEQYDEFTLKVYKTIADQQQVENRTQHYLSRLLVCVRNKEGQVSGEHVSSLTKMIAERKKDIGYFELTSLYDLQGGSSEEKATAARKYVESWEKVNSTQNVPIGDLVFANPAIQQAILDSCSPSTRQKLEKEIENRKR